MEILINLIVVYIIYSIAKRFISNCIKDHKHQTVLNLLARGDVEAFTKYVNKNY